MVSDNTIAEIKSRLNIVDIVSEYVPLKRAGQTFLGLCPFHKEKTPSFNVHPSRQCFHCFGCHKGGDIFTFISSVEGLSFPQVLEKLAARAGVTLEKTRYKPTVQPPSPELIKASESLEWATKYYHFMLTKRSEGKAALAYLSKRGITDKSIERFRLGFAPDGWTGLRDQMLKRGFTPKVLAEAGLITIREEENKSYDRFRNRILFPIADKDGKVIGFGARVLTEAEGQPKYINSSDTPIFSKRRNLYGIFENTRGIRLRGEAVIVEGYMDVVGLWEKGVDNAVAVMGTALSEDHCRQLRSLTQRVVTVFDPDAAGEGAWRSSIHTLMEQGLLARDVTLPNGKDPDDFVKDQGAEAFFSLCEKAPRQITKWLKQIAVRGKLSETERTDVLNEIAPLLRATRKLPDRLTLWDDIGLVLGISSSTLKEICDSPSNTPAPSSQSSPAHRNRPAAVSRVKGGDALDFAFFKSALSNSDRFRKTPKEGWFPTLRNAEMRDALLSLYNSDEVGSVARFQEVLTQKTLPGEVISVITAYLIGGSQPNPDSETEFRDILRQLSKRVLENEIHSLSSQAKLAQRMGDEKGALELLGKIRELRSGLESDSQPRSA